MQTQILSSHDFIEKIKNLKRQVNYRAMYNSWLGGIVTDPSLMMLPIDDHLVHRGDGVFEAIKFLDPKKVYLMKPHLERLQVSSSRLGMELPFSIEQIQKIILETIQASQLQKGLVRLFVSRGPGGFSTNPYETLGAQLYVVITELQSPSEEKYKKGVTLGKSQWIAKTSWHAQIKSCNYLHNVMMKKEALDRKLDFTVSLDSEGFVTEGSTENLVILNKDGFLLHPNLTRILKGTTMMRAFELAQSLVQKGLIKGAMEKDFTEPDLLLAQELMLMGTTLDVLPIREYEGHFWTQFPIATALRELVLQDQNEVIS